MAFKIKTSKKVTAKDFIADISSLSVGELVVHIEHGIGRFLGLENITAGGAPHDCLKIMYANDAKLFVPVVSIHSAIPRNDQVAPLSSDAYTFV